MAGAGTVAGDGPEDEGETNEAGKRIMFAKVDLDSFILSNRTRAGHRLQAASQSCPRQPPDGQEYVCEDVLTRTNTLCMVSLNATNKDSRI